MFLSLYIHVRQHFYYHYSGTQEFSLSMYQTPDLTEKDAKNVCEMFAEELAESISESKYVELPPLRFMKETAKRSNITMDAVIIDVDQQDFEEYESMRNAMENVDDLKTEADIDDVSIADWNDEPVNVREYEALTCEEVFELDDDKLEIAKTKTISEETLVHQEAVLNTNTVEVKIENTETTDSLTQKQQVIKEKAAQAKNQSGEKVSKSGAGKPASHSTGTSDTIEKKDISASPIDLISGADKKTDDDLSTDSKSGAVKDPEPQDKYDAKDTMSQDNNEGEESKEFAKTASPMETELEKDDLNLTVKQKEIRQKAADAKQRSQSANVGDADSKTIDNDSTNTNIIEKANTTEVKDITIQKTDSNEESLQKSESINKLDDKNIEGSIDENKSLQQTESTQEKEKLTLTPKQKKIKKKAADAKMKAQNNDPDNATKNSDTDITNADIVLKAAKEDADEIIDFTLQSLDSKEEPVEKSEETRLFDDIKPEEDIDEDSSLTVQQREIKKKAAEAKQRSKKTIDTDNSNIVAVKENNDEIIDFTLQKRRDSYEEALSTQPIDAEAKQTAVSIESKDSKATESQESVKYEIVEKKVEETSSATQTPKQKKKKMDKHKNKHPDSKDEKDHTEPESKTYVLEACIKNATEMLLCIDANIGRTVVPENKNDEKEVESTENKADTDNERHPCDQKDKLGEMTAEEKPLPDTDSDEKTNTLPFEKSIIEKDVINDDVSVIDASKEIVQVTEESTGKSESEIDTENLTVKQKEIKKRALDAKKRNQETVDIGDETKPLADIEVIGIITDVDHQSQENENKNVIAYEIKPLADIEVIGIITDVDQHSQENENKNVIEDEKNSLADIEVIGIITDVDQPSQENENITDIGDKSIMPEESKDVMPLESINVNKENNVVETQQSIIKDNDKDIESTENVSDCLTKKQKDIKEKAAKAKQSTIDTTDLTSEQQTLGIVECAAIPVGAKSVDELDKKANKISSIAETKPLDSEDTSKLEIKPPADIEIIGIITDVDQMSQETENTIFIGDKCIMLEESKDVMPLESINVNKENNVVETQQSIIKDNDKDIESTENVSDCLTKKQKDIKEKAAKAKQSTIDTIDLTSGQQTLDIVEGIPVPVHVESVESDKKAKKISSVTEMESLDSEITPNLEIKPLADSLTKKEKVDVESISPCDIEESEKDETEEKKQEDCDESFDLKKVAKVGQLTVDTTDSTSEHQTLQIDEGIAVSINVESVDEPDQKATKVFSVTEKEAVDSNNTPELETKPFADHARKNAKDVPVEISDIDISKELKPIFEMTQVPEYNMGEVIERTKKTSRQESVVDSESLPDIETFNKDDSLIKDGLENKDVLDDEDLEFDEKYMNRRASSYDNAIAGMDPDLLEELGLGPDKEDTVENIEKEVRRSSRRSSSYEETLAGMDPER